MLSPAELLPSRQHSCPPALQRARPKALLSLPFLLYQSDPPHPTRRGNSVPTNIFRPAPVPRQGQHEIKARSSPSLSFFWSFRSCVGGQRRNALFSGSDLAPRMLISKGRRNIRQETQPPGTNSVLSIQTWAMADRARAALTHALLRRRVRLFFLSCPHPAGPRRKYGGIRKMFRIDLLNVRQNPV